MDEITQSKIDEAIDKVNLLTGRLKFDIAIAFNDNDIETNGYGTVFPIINALFERQMCHTIYITKLIDTLIEQITQMNDDLYDINLVDSGIIAKINTYKDDLLIVMTSEPEALATTPETVESIYTTALTKLKTDLRYEINDRITAYDVTSMLLNTDSIFYSLLEKIPTVIAKKINGKVLPVTLRDTTNYINLLISALLLEFESNEEVVVAMGSLDNLVNLMTNTILSNEFSIKLNNYIESCKSIISGLTINF